jgi:hypothetical protein
MAERVEKYPEKPPEKNVHIDPPEWVEERTEWLEAIDDVLKHHGPDTHLGPIPPHFDSAPLLTPSAIRARSAGTMDGVVSRGPSTR